MIARPIANIAEERTAKGCRGLSSAMRLTMPPHNATRIPMPTSFTVRRELLATET
jgi:hypothetical protein